MAVVWGSYHGHLALGIDVSISPATVVAGTSSVTVTWSIWVKTDGWGLNGDGETVTLSNATTGSRYYHYDTSDMGIPYRVGQWSHSVATSYTGTVSKTLSVEMDSYLYGTWSQSRTVTIPKRPSQVPSAPPAASVARVSDTSHTVSWTRAANYADAAYAWDNVVVQRSVDGASYATVATVAGSSTSWTDPSTTANRQYRYRVSSKNETGSSGYAYTAFIETTPAAPTKPTAVKSGSDILITWTDPTDLTTSFKIQDSADGGSTWSDLATPPETSGSAESYLHVSANPSVTHTYRVQTVGSGGLLSAWSPISDTVQLLTNPGPPAGLTPNGGAADIDIPLVLAWTHVSVDTTAQKKYELQHRLAGGSWTNTGQVTSGTSSRAVTGYASGDTVEWQVRTWGDYVDPSPWSAVASFTLASKPTATINSPTPAQVIVTSSVTVDWSYFQLNGHPQSSWRVRIKDDATGAYVAAKEASGAATSWTSGPVLANNRDYTIEVRVVESQGLVSLDDTVSVSVAYAPPMDPTATAEWVWGEGYVLLSVAANEDGVAPATESLRVERREEDGSYRIMGSDLASDSSILDWETRVGSIVEYRVTAVSASGSEASVTVPVSTSSYFVAAYLSGGPGFSKSCAFAFNVTRSLTTGRDRVLNQYDGKSSPTETSGVVVGRSMSVKATVLRDPTEVWDWAAEFKAIEELFSYPGPHLYRDRDGWMMYCSVSDVQMELAGSGDVSFTVTETERGTDDQLGAISVITGPTLVEVSPGEYRVYGSSMSSSLAGEWVSG